MSQASWCSKRPHGFLESPKEIHELAEEDKRCVDFRANTGGDKTIIRSFASMSACSPSRLNIGLVKPSNNRADLESKNTSPMHSKSADLFPMLSPFASPPMPWMMKNALSQQSITEAYYDMKGELKLTFYANHVERIANGSTSSHCLEQDVGLEENPSGLLNSPPDTHLSQPTHFVPFVPSSEVVLYVIMLETDIKGCQRVGP